MPAVNDVLLETTLPGHTRHRVWAHPELQSHSLLVLTFEQLYAAPLTGTPRAEAVAEAEAGGELDALLGPFAVVVDLGTIRRAKLDLLTNSIVIEYATRGVGTGRLKVTFATPEIADACYTKLWRRLGDRVRLLPYKREAWALARAPLGLLAAALVATAALALTLSVVEDTASERAVQRAGSAVAPPPRSPLMALVGRVSWQAVCAAGGVGAALAQVWLYRRLTSPPQALEIVRD